MKMLKQISEAIRKYMTKYACVSCPSLVSPVITMRESRLRWFGHYVWSNKSKAETNDANGCGRKGKKNEK